MRRPFATLRIPFDQTAVRAAPAALFALATLLATPTPARAQAAHGLFPEEHRDLLSAASFRMLFGLDASPLAPGLPAVPGLGPPPGVGPNVRVNDPQLPFPDGLLGRSETTLAATGGGLHVVVGWNDAEGFCGPPVDLACPDPSVPGTTGYGVSVDGGATWTDGGAPPTGTRIGFGPGPAGTSASGVYVTGGDPSLDAAEASPGTVGPGSATVWFANLGFFDDFAANTAGIAVHAGRFGPGGSFAWDEPTLLQSPSYPGDFLDKEHVAARREGSSESVYVTLTNFIEVGGIPAFGLGQIEAYSSQDAGATWGRSVIQPDETISVAAGTGVINQGSEPAIAPHGTVHVAWQRGFLSPFFGQAAAGVFPEIRAARSTDGGATWQPAAAGPPSSGVNPAGVLVAPICAGDLFPPSGYSRNRSNTFPRTAVAGSGPHRGRVYVVWQDCRIANGGVMPAPPGPEDPPGLGDVGHPDTDVFLAFSDDGGATWSPPVLVAGGGDGLIQFWPTISLAPSGAVDVTYYESFEPAGTGFLGSGGGTSLVDVGWARSSDGGASFGAPVRVTEVTSDWGAAVSNINPNFGDYNDAVTLGGRVYVTWADGRNGVPDVFFAEAQGDEGQDAP